MIRGLALAQGFDDATTQALIDDLKAGGTRFADYLAAQSSGIGRLLEDVGSQRALDSLDLGTLPDEPLDLTGIPVDIHERVTEISGLADGCCDNIFPPPVYPRTVPLEREVRTACRRFVARAAAADPAIFRRKSRTDTAAAVVVWAVYRGNGLFENEDGVGAAQISAYFGVGSSAERARPMLRALGVRWSGNRNPLGDVALLVQEKRFDISEELAHHNGHDGDDFDHDFDEGDDE